MAISAISVLLEKHGGADDPMPATFSLPAGADLRRLLAVLAAFAIYFLAMPVLGNMIASALFLLASMWLLSDDPGRSVVRLAIYAVVIAIAFEWFFVRLLKVQMPAGVFKQWLFLASGDIEMNSVQGLLYGLSIAATPGNLLAAFVGAFAGTAIGVLPGLGPVAGVALILPLTFSLDPTAGLIMMAGIFYGSMYGGSTTAILLNIPGESASVVTAIDGYQLAKKGRAGATLTIVAVGSFVGGTLAVVGVMMFSSLLANVAILFGPAEFFALTAGGLIVMSRISGGTLASALLPMTLGLMLGTIGQEAVTGETRFTFGLPELAEGVSLVPVVVGLYGFAELMLLVEDRVHAASRPESVKMRDLLPTPPNGNARCRPGCAARSWASCSAWCRDRRRRWPRSRPTVWRRRPRNMRPRSAAAPSKASRARRPPTIPPPPPRWCRCSRSAFPSRRSRP